MVLHLATVALDYYLTWKRCLFSVLLG